MKRDYFGYPPDFSKIRLVWHSSYKSVIFGAKKRGKNSPKKCEKIQGKTTPKITPNGPKKKARKQPKMDQKNNQKSTQNQPPTRGQNRAK